MDLVRLGKEYNEAANLTGFFNEDEEIREEMIYNRMGAIFLPMRLIW